jgi:2'-5' RNA ligase
MRALVYIKPPVEILEEINLNVKNPPKSGIHCTLCNFNINRTTQDFLSRHLSTIDFQNFVLRFGEYDRFDNNSLVVRLEPCNEIFDLHRNIANISREYDKDPSLL